MMMVNDDQVDVSSHEGGATILRFEVLDPEASMLEGEDVKAYVMVWMLNNSYFVWIGMKNGSGALGDIYTGMQGRFDGGQPIATRVTDLNHGKSGSAVTEGMAKRLAKRLGAIVHVSCSLPQSQVSLARLVEVAIPKQVTAQKK